MPVLIEIHEDGIKKLMDCRKLTKGRNFSGWSLESLMYEAIIEFNEKYAKEGK